MDARRFALGLRLFWVANVGLYPPESMPIRSDVASAFEGGAASTAEATRAAGTNNARIMLSRLSRSVRAQFVGGLACSKKRLSLRSGHDLLPQTMGATVASVC
jgi:hypothetical protein